MAGTGSNDVEILCGLFSGLPKEVVEDVCNATEAASDFNSRLRHCLLLDPDHRLNVVARHIKASPKTPLMILLRGLPGSGKTTLAKCLAVSCEDSIATTVSADDFFLDPSGNYVYLPNLIPKAHDWARARAKKAMKRKDPLVIVDNTNIQAWEMHPYCKLAAEQGYAVLIFEPETTWSLDSKTLAAKTTHRVPQDKIELMRSRYEKELTAESVCAGLQPPRPKVLTLEKIIQNSERSGQSSPEDAAAAFPSATNKSNEDFQSLLSCFPHLSVHQIYPLYLQADGNVEEAVGLILEESQQQDSNGGGSDDAIFTMTLDAQFAARIEDKFGNTRRGENFPGLLETKVSASLARAIHQHWSREVREKLSVNAVRRFQDDLDQISHGQFYSSKAAAAQERHAIGANPGLDDEYYESANYDGDAGEEWTEIKKVPPNVRRAELKALRERRVDLYQKAAAAFKKKSGGEAFYYSEEGRKLTDKINSLETDFRYQLFLDSNPLGSCKLDLHGLSAAEAAERLEWWLEAKTRELRKEPGGQTTKKLEVVVGRGLGSRGGKVKIKPAVESFLRENGYSHSEGLNEGAIVVVIRK